MKPENIKFIDDESGSLLKILDFGFAKAITAEETLPCFTLDYAAPESLSKGETKISRDLWSLGVILYTMLCGNTPFKPLSVGREQDDRNYRWQVTDNIKKGLYNTDNNRWIEISSNAKDLIKSLLKVNDSERLSLHEVKRHAWMCANDEDDNITSLKDLLIHRIESEQTIVGETDDEEDELLQDFNDDGEEDIDDDDDDDEDEDDEDNLKKSQVLENHERTRSNDDESSSGIVMSERNEGSSSISSHHEEIEEQSVNQIVCNDEHDSIENLRKSTTHSDEELPLIADEPIELEKQASEKLSQVSDEDFKGFDPLIEENDDECPHAGFSVAEQKINENQCYVLYEPLLAMKNISICHIDVENPIAKKGRGRKKAPANANDVKILQVQISNEPSIKRRGRGGGPARKYMESEIVNENCNINKQEIQTPASIDSSNLNKRRGRGRPPGRKNMESEIVNESCNINQTQIQIPVSIEPIQTVRGRKKPGVKTEIEKLISSNNNIVVRRSLRQQEQVPTKKTYQPPLTRNVKRATVSDNQPSQQINKRNVKPEKLDYESCIIQIFQPVVPQKRVSLRKRKIEMPDFLVDEETVKKKQKIEPKRRGRSRRKEVDTIPVLQPATIFIKPEKIHNSAIIQITHQQPQQTTPIFCQRMQLATNYIDNKDRKSMILERTESMLFNEQQDAHNYFGNINPSSGSTKNLIR